MNPVFIILTFETLCPRSRVEVLSAVSEDDKILSKYVSVPYDRVKRSMSEKLHW